MSARQDLETIELAPNKFIGAVQMQLEAIPQAFFSEEDCARLLSVIANKVESSNWKHFEIADTVMNTLDELVSDIEGRGTLKATLQAIAMHAGKGAR